MVFWVCVVVSSEMTDSDHPIEIGPGKLSVEGLASTGSHHPEVGANDEFRTIGQTYRDNFGAQGYWGYLYITAPNPPSASRRGFPCRSTPQ